MTFSNRYLITLFSSMIRAGLNFFASVKVANYLMPELYGQYQYILTLSTAILLLINFGTENAFYTFISEKKQHFKFYLTYFIWQLVQIMVVLLFVIYSSDNAYQFVFKGAEVSLLITAIVALFFLGTIQNSLNHILESIRKTSVSQSLMITVSVLHVILLLNFIYQDKLDPKILFQIIMFEYILYSLTVIAIIRSRKFDLFSNEPFSLSYMILRFYKYCKPLIVLSIAAALYTVVDRWLIQTYIGSSGQAYFAISMQFSTIGVLLASSISSIFRKEISESISSDNLPKLQLYYQIISKNIFLITTMICTVLFVYSTDVLLFFYGESYKDADLIFKLIMLLPITQATGTVYVSFLYASSQTKISAYVSYFFIPIAILLSIFFISDLGLNLGIEGVGVRLLITDTLYILVLEYFICRYLGINCTYLYKFTSFLVFILTAYLIKYIFESIQVNFLSQVGIVSIFYIVPFGYYLFNKVQTQLDTNF